MSIYGATVIRTGYSRGSGYDKIFLKKVDGRVVELNVETTSDGDECIGVMDVVDDLKKRIKKYKEDIEEYEDKIKEIEKW